MHGRAAETSHTSHVLQWLSHRHNFLGPADPGSTSIIVLDPLCDAAGGNFSVQDMVALSGAHTIGHSRSVAPTVSGSILLHVCVRCTANQSKHATGQIVEKCPVVPTCMQWYNADPSFRQPDTCCNRSAMRFGDDPDDALQPCCGRRIGMCCIIHASSTRHAPVDWHLYPATMFAGHIPA